MNTPLSESHPRAKPIQFKVLSNGCWECVSHRVDKGYVMIERNGTSTTMHRWLYMKANPGFDKRLVVRHMCNNSKCINLDHLKAGTQKENIADRKNAGTYQYGEKNHQSKLSEKDVQAIRDSSKERKSLAELYGVSKRTIGNIKTGYSWARDKSTRRPYGTAK